MASSVRIPGIDLIDHLIKLGIVHEETRRVILDVAYDDVPVLYVERLGTNKLLDIDWGTHAGEIRVVDADDEEDVGAAQRHLESTLPSFDSLSNG